MGRNGFETMMELSAPPGVMYTGTSDPHNEFAGKYNPFNKLCRAYGGHVYANFLVTSYAYVEHSNWIMKALVIDKEDCQKMAIYGNNSEKTYNMK